MKLIECRRCAGSGLEVEMETMDEQGNFNTVLCEKCSGSGYTQSFSLKDQMNWIVLVWGYFCLVLFIYAILFGKVTLR